VQFNVRLTEELRKRLELAAKDSERSLNSEIVIRLAKSFQTEELLWNIFGGKGLPEALRNEMHTWVGRLVRALPNEPSAEPYEDEFAQHESRPVEPLPLEEADLTPSDEARRTLYERARADLIEQLRGIDPPLSEAEITRERLALEDAIRKVEAHARARPRSIPDQEPELPLPVRARPRTRRQELAARYDVARDDQAPSPLQPLKGDKS
jgi:hypothetical protein